MEAFAKLFKALDDEETRLNQELWEVEPCSLEEEEMVDKLLEIQRLKDGWTDPDFPFWPFIENYGRSQHGN